VSIDDALRVAELLAPTLTANDPAPVAKAAK